MIYLWDTDTCIYHLNGHARITEKIRHVGAASISTTMITIAELEFGAYNSIRVKENLRKIEALQRTIIVLSDFNAAIARRFAENKSVLRKSGFSVGDFDLLIASFALHYGLIIVTNNTKHFERIPDVKLENWWKTLSVGLV